MSFVAKCKFDVKFKYSDGTSRVQQLRVHTVTYNVP